jgi:uncharacterized protein YndB with AHSA1/START domain
VVRVELAIEIERPLADVFAYVTDPDHLPEWQESAVAIRKISDRRWDEERRIAGRRVECEVEVTDLEPDKQFNLRSHAKPVEFEVEHLFSETDGGTRIKVTAKGKTRGLMRFAEGTIESRAHKELEADFERLKAILEAKGR